jgi:hypothetical protein
MKVISTIIGMGLIFLTGCVALDNTMGKIAKIQNCFLDILYLYGYNIACMK